MRQALTPPFVLAAAILVIAGLAKLRTPAGMIRALGVLGLPSGLATARGLAIAEVAVGSWAAVTPVRPAAATVAGLYLAFALSATALARRSASCGCFGQAESPASIAQALLSAGLAGVAVAAAVVAPHGLGWVLGRPSASGLALIVGITGAAYAAVLVYTELPRAWNAWSPR